MFFSGEEGALIVEEEKNWLKSWIESEQNKGLEATFLASYLKSRLQLFRGDEYAHYPGYGIVLICQNVKLYTFNMYDLLHFNGNSTKLF